MCKLECLHPCVLVLALALALLLCIKFLGAWQQCVHYNKNNNAYNADTTSDAIQAMCAIQQAVNFFPQFFLWTWFAIENRVPQQRWTLAVPEQTEQINKHTQKTTNNNPNLRQCDVQKPHAHQTSVGAWKKCTHQAPFAAFPPWLPAQGFFCWSCAFVHFFQPAGSVSCALLWWCP